MIQKDRDIGDLKIKHQQEIDTLIAENQLLNSNHGDKINELENHHLNGITDIQTEHDQLMS